MTDLGPSPLARGDDQLSVEAARAAILDHLRPIDGHETVPLARALSRVLAHDVISPIDVPAHDNSAMDGYAFDGAALASQAGQAAQGPSRFRVAGIVYAGTPHPQPVAAGDCVRIMTGAVMPDGCDTVVPHELCRAGADAMELDAGTVQRGENRRRRGEDLARGKPALVAGRRLRPADLGLVASLGLTEVSVRRRLRVALFSTGDELRAPGEPLPPGCIYDSNRASLLAALQRLDVDVIDLGLVRDDPAALAATLEAAVTQADAVVTSGGVSMGDADHTRDVLARLGQVSFWKVAMRPGRPFAFGPLRLNGEASPQADDVRRPPPEGDEQSGKATFAHGALLFALPGNPVAALVTFYAFVREALLAMAGVSAADRGLVTLSARSPVAIRKRPGRTEFQRGIVSRAADGGWEVRTTGAQGAGILRSLSEANALVVLDHAQGSVAAGEQVTVWLFDGLV